MGASFAIGHYVAHVMVSTRRALFVQSRVTEVRCRGLLCPRDDGRAGATPSDAKHHPPSLPQQLQSERLEQLAVEKERMHWSLQLAEQRLSAPLHMPSEADRLSSDGTNSELEAVLAPSTRPRRVHRRARSPARPGLRGSPRQGDLCAAVLRRRYQLSLAENTGRGTANLDATCCSHLDIDLC